MITQKHFPFKVAHSKEAITPRGGLAIYAEFLRHFGIKDMVERLMPEPGSNRGYRAWHYIEPILLMLTGGGRHIEELREIIQDRGLRKLIGLTHIPSPSTVGDWLRRQGRGEGLRKLKQVIAQINRKALMMDTHKEYTFYSDPTIIESNKQDAVMTYLGVKGYRPIITVLNDIPLIMYHEFREGNATGRVMDAVERVYELLPEGKRIKHASLDSEYYRVDVMEYLRGKGTTFCIAVDKDRAVREVIKTIGKWKPYKDREGVATDREIGETVHTMERMSFSFRLIVLRWRDGQRNLFSDGYNYHCIATDLKSSAEEVVWEYNQRVHIENVIKELKNGFGMEDMPTGDFWANSFWFSLGVLAYNSFIMKKYFVLPEEYKVKTIQSIRWVLIDVAGKVVEHARSFLLRVCAEAEKVKLYKGIMMRVVELMT